MIGSERTHEFTAEGQLLTDVGWTIPVRVLSTPGMIGTGTAAPWAVVGERCAAMLALEHLGEGPATVGFEVREGDKVLGVGTHERRVVQRA